MDVVVGEDDKTDADADVENEVGDEEEAEDALKQKATSRGDR